MRTRTIVTFLLLFTVLLSIFTGALATETEDELPDIDTETDAVAAPPETYEPTWEDFTDTSGHWAESTLKKGFQDGLLNGFPDYTIRPDSAVTTAQMITILTRVLGAVQRLDISSWGIDSGTWYYEAAGKAAFLGLIDSATGSLDAAMTRQDALSMMAKAFSLTPANPDLSVLDAFSDSGMLKGVNKAAIAALVADGLVQGSGGVLNVNGNIKRAEFFTVLYRVAENYVTAAELTGTLTGGSIVAGSSSVTGITLGKIWFDCAAENVSLTSVAAESVTLKSHALASLRIGGSSRLGTLVIDCGSASASLGELNGITLDTIRLQSGGSLSLTDSVIKNIEITGDYQTVTIGGSHERLTVSGIGNEITLLDEANINEIVVLGKNTHITGSGTAEKLTLNAIGCTIDIVVSSLADNSKSYETDRVLELVTSEYKGNYTLAWAQANDYEAYEKEMWINAKGYSSKTGYLIWVNLAMQRVNIFSGAEGNWTLIRSCIIGSGAPKTGTPVGVYHTTYKLAAGWTTSTYTCRPVVGFKENTGYAFHSRLYYPNTNKLTDASIGYPVSHGCIRMYDEDINYIYNSIPLGTTVVVY